MPDEHASSPPLHRIEVGARPEVRDSLADAVREKLRRALPHLDLDSVRRVDVITLASRHDPRELAAIASVLANPVSRAVSVDAPLVTAGFDVAIEIGFLPGVTDNVATTVRKLVADAARPLGLDESVHSARLYLLTGSLAERDVSAAAALLANPLIERVRVKSAADYAARGGMERVAPRVVLAPHPLADLVPLDVPDDELGRIGREGIPDEAGAAGAGIARRGPLALDLASMHVIRDHFASQARAPTDVELESIAQNWSEHCRHLFFNSPIDDVKEGLFKRYIRGATEKIRSARGEGDPCVSVFSDNAGAIAFDEHWLVTDKVETHNSPSALDPFGGALTGILGVNRDALGFGLGARPILNRYGFCLPWPSDHRVLFRRRDAEAGAPTDPLLDPVRLADGIIDGVEHGGNCSGIPTPQGFLAFHAGFRAKPLVFVGTLGLIPREETGRRLHEKGARPGDRIVVIGGRVGKDGIHGATFSSEALAASSPATAVQIGDPITQKLLADALVREARGRALYSSLTDNGAGGLSCSVTEMARESGGCLVELDRVPRKYAGMAPWEVWVSESQERMTLAVPPEHLEELLALFASRDVEATDLGEFTRSGRAVVRAGTVVVMDLPLDFLHDGWPRHHLRSQPRTTVSSTTTSPPALHSVDGTASDLRERLLAFLATPGFSSHEDVTRRFDHEVQGTSVLKPLAGPGRVNTDATAVRPLLGDSWRGVAVSQALAPHLTEHDPYGMALWCVDTAVRRLVALGAPLAGTALLDNFCWSSPHDPSRLHELHEACRACHDAAVAYGTPFISGKDSMFNDFRGFDAEGADVKLSVPPTLLISSLAVVADVRALVTLDLKSAGDVVFLLDAALGSTARFDPLAARTQYDGFTRLVGAGEVTAAIAVASGGLAYATARMSIAGELGLELDLGADGPLAIAALFAEGAGRILFTTTPGGAASVASALPTLGGVRRVGSVIRSPILALSPSTAHRFSLDELAAAYRSPWRRT